MRIFLIALFLVAFGFVACDDSGTSSTEQNADTEQVSPISSGERRTGSPSDNWDWRSSDFVFVIPQSIIQGVHSHYQIDTFERPEWYPYKSNPGSCHNSRMAHIFLH